MSDAIAWQSDYGAAVGAARKGNLLLVVHFASADRPMCRVMADETFSFAEVVRRSNARFVNVKLDASDRAELFERLVGDRGALATCILDASEDVISMLPGFADARRYLEFLDNAENGYAALMLLRNAARNHKSDLYAAARLGRSYDALGSQRRAEETYRAAIALAPAHLAADAMDAVASCREGLARILVARGKSVEAREQLDEVRKLDPDAHGKHADRFLLTHILLLSLERNLRDAVARLGDLLQRFPASDERPQALFVLGSLQHELREDAAALSNLETLVVEHPTSRWVEPARQQIEHIRSPESAHQH